MGGSDDSCTSRVVAKEKRLPGPVFVALVVTLTYSLCSPGGGGGGAIPTSMCFYSFVCVACVGRACVCMLSAPLSDGVLPRQLQRHPCCCSSHARRSRVMGCNRVSCRHGCKLSHDFRYMVPGKWLAGASGVYPSLTRLCNYHLAVVGNWLAHVSELR